MLKNTSLLRVVPESEKILVDQVPEEVHPPIRDGLASVILLRILTFPATQASPGAYNPSLLFTNAFII